MYSYRHAIKQFYLIFGTVLLDRQEFSLAHDAVPVDGVGDQQGAMTAQAWQLFRGVENSALCPPSAVAVLPTKSAGANGTASGITDCP